MDQCKTARLEHGINGFEVSLQIGAAHVLEHADRADLVERLHITHLPVVAQLDPDLALQALLGDQVLHMLELVARQRDAMGLHAVMLGRPEDQPAPTGTDIPEALARLELELFADVIELGLLRLGQAHALLLVVRAGIDAARIQPQRVEVIGKIVMKLNLLGITRQRVHGQRSGL
ncbi:hypothetical protein SDC9_189006 [bioreactor metagenome]|uniref:Uncharacterized protein n=1 Tax=bioreactor metagenome TaxID=1076179 RepID=A0A645HRH2_9ZZZZ